MCRPSNIMKSSTRNDKFWDLHGKNYTAGTCLNKVQLNRGFRSLISVTENSETLNLPYMFHSNTEELTQTLEFNRIS